MTDKELNRYLERTASELGEHFEAVQLLVSTTEQGETQMLHCGNGNWYARQGMAGEFIDIARAECQANEIAQRLNGDDDEGQNWKGT